MPVKRICPFCATQSIQITAIDSKTPANPIKLRKDSSPTVERICEPVCIACGSDSKRIGETKNILSVPEELWKCMKCGQEFEYAEQTHQCKKCFRYWGYSTEFIQSILNEHVESEVYPAYSDPEDTKDILVTIDSVLENGFTSHEIDRVGGAKALKGWHEKWERLKEEWGIMIIWEEGDHGEQ